MEEDIQNTAIRDLFTNLPEIPFSDPNDPRFGSDVFRMIKELQVGYGTKVLRVDQTGMWLGAETFAEAPFSVDMLGNVIGESYATAATGERIVIGTGDTNQIKFYDDAALYGVLEVHNVLGTGYITLGVVAGDSIEAGIRVDTDIGASGFNATDMVSNGGRFRTEGNASSGFNNIFGKTSLGADKFFGVQTIAGVDYLITDLLPTGDPSVSGALYLDTITGAVMQSP